MRTHIVPHERRQPREEIVEALAAGPRRKQVHGLHRESGRGVKKCSDLGVDAQPRCQERLLGTLENVDRRSAAFGGVLVGAVDLAGIGLKPDAQQDERVEQEIETLSRLVGAVQSIQHVRARSILAASSAAHAAFVVVASWSNCG